MTPRAEPQAEVTVGNCRISCWEDGVVSVHVDGRYGTFSHNGAKKVAQMLSEWTAKPLESPWKEQMEWLTKNAEQV